MSTARALELSCEVLALQAIPHITLCFAFLFNEGATAPGKTSRVSTDSMAASPAQGEGRAEKLSSRLLGAMEVRMVHGARRGCGKAGSGQESSCASRPEIRKRRFGSLKDPPGSTLVFALYFRAFENSSLVVFILILSQWIEGTK